MEINGASPITTIAGFSSWRCWQVCGTVHELEHSALEAVAVAGIYPDLLHILDLALLPDMYASALILYTDDTSIYEGRSSA